MKAFFTRIKLRYHEGAGPTMTLAQADACPDWTPLWICSEAVLHFDAGATYKKPVEYFTDYNQRSTADDIGTVMRQKMDLLIAIPHEAASEADSAYVVDDAEEGIVVVRQRTDYLTIHHATVPQCVSNEFPRKRLLNAPHFRALHSKGFFSIVTSAYAERVLQEPAAQKTADVLRDMKARIYSNNYKGGD